MKKTTTFAKLLQANKKAQNEILSYVKDGLDCHAIVDKYGNIDIYEGYDPYNNLPNPDDIFSTNFEVYDYQECSDRIPNNPNAKVVREGFIERILDGGSYIELTIEK
ncbi:hypothetical protein [Anaerococcus sp. AGMB09787]|uniref:hypothetical protein n=1 Tax=Anaerococcus sp. AGMB09787 TaxID=2922869 RepID=UPI001FAE9616|nr:hypothetical protein [Anaerococcus sp. AGMB09787]